VIIREMTKIHEETFRGTVGEALADLASRPRKGEFTIVVQGDVAPARAVQEPPADLKEAYEALLRSGVPRKEALRTLARSSGRRRREIYREVASGDLRGRGEEE
jgi:16S rRNA (cytidine1402-2'-O)-methyltransferase